MSVSLGAPLTEGEIRHLAGGAAALLYPLYKDHCEKQEQFENRKAAAKIKEMEADKRIADSAKKIEETGKALQIKTEEKSKLDEKEKAIFLKEQRLIAKIFCSVFHGAEKFTETQLDEIFKEYLTDKSISMDKDHYYLNSMSPFIRYSKNPAKKVTKCDFRVFRENIKDIPTLAAHLGESTSSIMAIAISNKISGADQKDLTAAKTRKKGLKVVYI